MVIESLRKLVNSTNRSRIYDLFKRTKVPLIDYHLSGPNCPARFNGITLFSKEGEPEDKDPFRVSKKHGGSVPDDQMMTLGSGMKTALNPLGNALKKGDADSFRQFDELDGLTVRDYLAQKMLYPPKSSGCCHNTNMSLGNSILIPFSG